MVWGLCKRVEEHDETETACLDGTCHAAAHDVHEFLCEVTVVHINAREQCWVVKQTRCVQEPPSSSEKGEVLAFFLFCKLPDMTP